MKTGQLAACVFKEKAPDQLAFLDPAVKHRTAVLSQFSHVDLIHQCYIQRWTRILTRREGRLTKEARGISYFLKIKLQKAKSGIRHTIIGHIGLQKQKLQFVHLLKGSEFLTYCIFLLSSASGCRASSKVESSPSTDGLFRQSMYFHVHLKLLPSADFNM